MSSVRKNRCRMTSTTTGTGTITLGSVVTGYTDFSIHGNGNTVPRFCIEGRNSDESLNGQWEICSGVYTALGTTLSRAAREDSSTGSAVSFSADHLIVYELLSAQDVSDLSPGGSDTQFQFNNSGVLGGSTALITVAGGVAFNDSIGHSRVVFFGGAGNNFGSFNKDGAGAIYNIDFANGFIGYFGASPVGQQASNQALTDSTTGTPGTTLVDVTTTALADPAKINNNIASIAARLAEIRTLLINYGLGS